MIALCGEEHIPSFLPVSTLLSAARMYKLKFRCIGIKQSASRLHFILGIGYESG